MAGSPLFPFGVEARRCHDEPDMIRVDQRRHLAVAEARGARGLGGHSQKLCKSRFVAIKPGEEFLQSRPAHGAASRPAANVARAASSCSSSRATKRTGPQTRRSPPSQGCH